MYKKMDCDFCGSPKRYVKGNKKPLLLSLKRVSGKLAMIANIGINIELGLYKFYSLAYEKTDENKVKDLFKKLSELSFNRAVVLKRIYTGEEKSYEEKASDSLLENLSTAMKKEEHASLIYFNLSREVKSKNVSKFLKIVSEIHENNMKLLRENLIS